MWSINEERNVLEGILAGLTNPTHLPLALLQDITENFSEKRKIGEGGFGEVYKGELRNGNVAVKRIVVNENTIDDKLFYREVKSMMKIINHPNVVRFLGFCSNTHHEAITKIGSEEIIFPQKRERLLCFEYISNGSLDKLITDELRGLEWDTRYQIIKEICEGLSYLHNEKGIIHMDLNPSNILLDDQMVPKITDFGLARLNKSTHTLGLRFGTRVYCAPEYEIHGKISNKCDLYSLGVIITELVTGYKVFPDINKVLRRWRHRWTKPPTLTQYKQVSKCIEMAICCRKEVPEGRPLVRDILHHLRETETKNGHNGQMNLYAEDDMLGIEPLELHFPFDHKKQISWSVELTNGTSNYFAFNIESPRLYGIQPNKGIVPPRSKCSVEITVQAQERPQQDMLYADDQFIVQSSKVKAGLADEDITDQVFNAAAGKVVDEVNLAIVYEREKPKVDLSHEPVTQDIQCRSHKRARVECTNQPERRNFHTPESSSHSQPSNVSHLPKGSNSAVDIATGAMGSLLPKLGELLKEKYNLEARMRTDVKTLESQLTWMQLIVRKVSKVQPDKLDDLVKIWAKEVRELSYDIEDVIDGFLSPTQGSEPAATTGGFRGLMHKMLNHFKWGKAPREIRDVIEDMKNQVQVVADAGKLYEVDGVVANPIATTAVDPRLLDLYKDQRKLVGIDGAAQQLTKWLTHVDGDVSQRQLKILSIFGCGGLGKTTLARVLYDKLKEQFNCTAFVIVGRDPDVKKIYRDILIELDKKYLNMNITIFDVKQLIDELRGILKNKRYFIVIDDIWDIEAWQVIKCALMDDNIGSRIITTTRIFKVAEKASDVYKLQPLSHDRSEELLWNTLLYVGGKGKWGNDEPIEVMNKILQKCGGVPLAIITIASLLASKPRDDWSKVYSSIGFGHGENIEVENTRKILLFSYYDLPFHLRSCLLHLSIYPEDYSINKDILIWKWVAEGFVHEEPCIGLFELGERYFNELINRSMIQPVQDYGFLGGIRGCRVHDMVLDIICLLAEEENFVTIWDISKRHKSPRSNVRRLAMQKIVMEQCDLMGMSQLRSFNVTECHLSMTPSLGSFLGLRVLYLKDCTGWTGDLQPVVRLIQLRYLGLTHTQIVELPSELGDLIFLQTLNLSGLCHFGELPRSVGRLRNLKCLCLPTTAGSIKVSFPLGDLVSLEKLSICHPTESPNLVKEFYKLTELRELRIDLGRFDHSSKKSLVESLNNLQNIRDLELDDYRRDEFREYLEGYMPPKRLGRLKLPDRYLDIPSWVNSSHVPNLSHLSVSVRNAKDLEILGRLPELIFLQLYMNLGSCLEVTVGGAFPKLRHCESDAPLRFQQGTMPKLETIQFMVVVADLKGANFDFDFGSIGNLLCLQRVSVQMHCQSDEVRVSDSEVEEAEAGLRHSVDNHPNRPSLSIKRHGYW